MKTILRTILAMALTAASLSNLGYAKSKGADQGTSGVKSLAVVAFRSTGNIAAQEGAGPVGSIKDLKNAFAALKGDTTVNTLPREVTAACFDTFMKEFTLEGVDMWNPEKLQAHAAYQALPEPKGFLSQQWLPGHRVVEANPNEIKKLVNELGVDAGLYVELKLARKPAGSLSVNNKQVAKMSDVSHIEATFQLVDQQGKVIYNNKIEKMAGLSKADLFGGTNRPDLMKDQFAKVMADITQKLNKDLPKRLIVARP